MENIVGWQYQRALPEEKVTLFEGLVEAMAQAVDVSEDKSSASSRVITIFFGTEAKREELLSALLLAEKVAGIIDKSAPVSLQPVYDEDWQDKMHRSFPPLVESGFFIYGFDEVVPEDKIGLHIPAGMAFGTGEHATTALCLRLYEDFTTQQTFENGLDMGAGSGILAIAAAKVQNTRFLAVDLDAPSVEACQENLINNGVSETVTAILGEGFAAPGVVARAPYDLIFANILKNPLIEMAQDVTQTLAENGVAILSGFTEDQKEDVVRAYTALGLKEVASLQRDTWCAVAVQS